MFARPEDMLDVVDVLRAVGGGLDAAALEHISCSALADEIERLRGMIANIRNFPSHPGEHPSDLSDDADDAASWRNGWICAVEAIQDALTYNASFSRKPSAASTVVLGG